MGLNAGLAVLSSEALPAQRSQIQHSEDLQQDVKTLQEPARVAERSLRRAFNQLRRVTVLDDDPRFDELRRALSRTLAAIDGRDPRDGDQVRPGYHGLREELTDAERRLDKGIANSRGGTDVSRQMVAGLQEAVVATAALRRHLDATAGAGDPGPAQVSRLDALARRLAAQVEKRQLGSARAVRPGA